MKHTYIDSERKLLTYLQKLAEDGTEIIAFDIECESNLHQYGEKLCLIQIYDGHDAVIIDPFKVPRKLVKSLVENRSIMKIMFDAPGDRAFLFKNCGMDILSVLDLQAAVLLLDYEKNDLSSVLEKAISISYKRSKKRFQRNNWNTRPIREAALDYALTDVIHLFELKDQLLADILKNGLLDKFILKNLQAQNKPHRYDSRPKVLRTKNFKQLAPGDQRLFEKLFALREKHAKKLNCSPNGLLTNETLFALVTEKKNLLTTDFGKRIPMKSRKAIIAAVGKLRYSR